MIKELEFLEGTLNQNLGTVVEVGAGSGSDLQEILALEPDLLVCIEANKQLVSSLEKRTKKVRNVRIVNEWITPGSEPVQIYEFSNPRYNSLAAPSEKLKSRPNLKLIANEKISGKPFAELLSELTFSEEKINLLVFSVPGSENILIQNSTEMLTVFDYIIIEPKNSDYYVTPWNITGRVDGFNLTNFNLNDNGISGFLYSRSSSREKEIQRELTSLKADYQRQSEAQLTSVEEAKALQGQLEQSQEQVVTLEAESVVLHKRVSDIAIYEGEVKSLQEQIEQASKLVASLQDEAEKHKAQFEESKQQYESQLQSLRSDLQQSVVKNEQTSEVLRSTSKLNLKLQADLDQLREQYSQKVKVEKELTELINELYIKLKQASEFYYILEAKYPEIAGKLND